MVLDRRAGPRIFAVTRPEDAEVARDFLVGHARVVGHAALARNSQLFEDRAWSLEGEAVRPPQRSGDVLEDPPVFARIPGAGHCLVDLDDAALDLGDRAFVLLLEAARQDDI